MNDENKARLKSLVAPGNLVHFTRYFDGQLWYKTYYTDTFGGQEFEFPVPISDIGNATFLPQDKAMLFMRYMRKHLEMLEKASEEQSLTLASN